VALRALLRRTDALDFAYATLLGEEWGSLQRRRPEMLETLEEICVDANGQFKSYKQEVGVSN
jgi:hypothetical protein